MSHNFKDYTGLALKNTIVVGLSHFNEHQKSIWVVKCKNCGLEFTRGTHGIKRDAVCKHCHNRPKGEAGLYSLFASYKCDAKRRKKSCPFELSLEEFGSITSSPCFYCGSPPSMLRRPRKYRSDSTWGDYIHNGVDRKDNATGYLSRNCVPCCHICNDGKHNRSVEEFMAYLKQVAIHIAQAADPLAVVKSLA